MIRRLLLASFLIGTPAIVEAKVCQSFEAARETWPSEYLRYTRVGERRCWYHGKHAPASQFRDVVPVFVKGKPILDTPNEIDALVDDESMRLRFEEAFVGWTDTNLLVAFRGISW
jgi:hypothetical protein